jgi:DNA-binding LytR/AlgR family response regulator
MKNILFQNKIKIKIGDSWHIFNPEAILFFSATEHTSMVTYSDGHIMEIDLTLNELDQKFNTFFQINDKYLINLEYLNNVSDLENGYVLIDNCYKFSIDSDKKRLLFEALNMLT